jgi:hypothetical protein
MGMIVVEGKMRLYPESRRSRYEKYYWCRHEGIWVPKSEAKRDRDGRPLCPYCNRYLRRRRMRK